MGAQIRRHVRAQTYAAQLTASQAAEFDLCHAGVTWFYNQACHSQLDRYRKNLSVENYNSLSYAVSVARSNGCEFPYQGGTRLVKDVPAVFLHGALRQLSGGWSRHFTMMSEDRPSGPPGFRSVHRGGSLYWQVQDGNGPRPVGKFIAVTRKATRDRPALATVKVPGGIGLVVIRYHRELPADTMIRFASVRVDDLGRYWVTVQYDTAQVRQPAPKGVVGVDVGVAVTAAASDGKVYDAPGLSPGEQERKDRLQRAMARKRKLNPCLHDQFVTVGGKVRLVSGYCPPPGRPDHNCRCWKHSRRYARDKTEFLKLSQRAVRRRTAGSHLASRALADNYAIVVMEELLVSNMTASAKGTEESPGRNVQAKAGLNREILARNWYQFRQFTNHKTQVATVPAAGTSQQCPRCGAVDPANRPERDVFRCASCGLTGHADIVAAQNIKGRYMAQTAAAQAAAARETCIPDREQPANSQPNSAERQEIVLQPTGDLVPQAWGKISAPQKRKRRRSRRLKTSNRDTSTWAARCDPDKEEV